MTCPCVPGETITEFADAYTAKFNDGARHLRARGLRRRQRVPGRHRGGHHRPRGDERVRVGLRRRGHQQAHLVRRERRESRRSRSGPTRSRTASSSRSSSWPDRGLPHYDCGRETHASPAARHARQDACSDRDGLRMEFLLNNFFALTVTGLVLGSRLRPDRPRLHAGLRRPAADQLRPLRSVHVRHFAAAWTVMAPGRRRASTVDTARRS